MNQLQMLFEEFRAQASANRHDLELQFERIAQLQMEIDEIKRILLMNGTSPGKNPNADTAVENLRRPVKRSSSA